jgi:hypothetical protein
VDGPPPVGLRRGIMAAAGSPIGLVREGDEIMLDCKPTRGATLIYCSIVTRDCYLPCLSFHRDVSRSAWSSLQSTMMWSSASRTWLPAGWGSTS